MTVIVTSYLNTPWYVKQLKQLTEPCPPGVDPAEHPTRLVCQRPFEAADLPEPLVQVGWTRSPRPPGDSIVPLSAEEIERFAATYFVAHEPMTLRAGETETRIEAGTTLLPADTFVAAILRATLGERPIHFMPGSPTVWKLGLFGHTVRQGIT